MTRRVIALLVLSAMLGLPFLAGCEHQHKDETKMKIDTEGGHKEVTIRKD